MATKPKRRRKRAAEKMDAVEIDRRRGQWSDAMHELHETSKSLGRITGVQYDNACNGELDKFTPMRADFTWAKRVTKQLRQIADEIERYR